ncbi:hypothetical protein [Kaistella pullorum]|nr:hypothetical protein [Kaistella pullorum]
MEEVGDARIVAVAENGFAFEVVFVVLQFVLYVCQLGIEISFLAFLA